ncbi:MAG TPA: ParB N-terminal domain-containing protein [Clostridiales bacterium]|nr:ParB N-terminal domain-containing protein [Clostridiales bacterium]HQP69329.1 ParB N-terminal domain-containing protein [Clostridiales bacterium]
MNTLTIGKKEFQVKEEEILQASLKFYVDNPRVYSALRVSDDIKPDQSNIEKLMISMEHVKQLRLSIESNGGLIDPLIVRDGDLVVLEGNSRLAAYRILCQKDPISWGKVKCLILPSDIDESSIFTLLGQYHIIGRKDWSPYEQAGYLYRRSKESKLSVDIMAKELGIKKGDAQRYLKVFSFMIETKDLEPTNWSYYDELLKNKSINNATKSHPELVNTLVLQIKNKEIQQASDIRKVGEIAKCPDKKAKKVLAEIASGQKDIYNGFEQVKDTGKIDSIYKKMRAFRELITDSEFADSINDSPEIKYEIKKILTLLNKFS